MTVGDWLASTRRRLGPVAGGQAEREARLILGEVTGWSAARVATAGPEALSSGQVQAAETMVRRRLAREPMAQILGQWGFFGRKFRVTRDTLVPRPDTETLIEHALAAPFSRMIDLGTGSGAIAVTLLAERPEAEGLATDISPAALEVAAGNAARHGVEGRLRLLEADWWAGVEGRFDLVVSNPPYVTEAEYAALAPEITRWEPRGALTPGGDGLAAYRAILAGIDAHLRPGGRCLVEIGAGQGAAVAALFRGAGLDAVAVHPDINGKPRVVEGAMPNGHARA